MNNNWHALTGPESCCCGGGARWLVVVGELSIPLCEYCAGQEFRDAEGKVVFLHRRGDKYILRKVVGNYLCGVLELNREGLERFVEVIIREVDRK